MPLSILRQKIDYSAVPWCTYLDPELATVGLTESKAKADGVEYDLIVQEMKEVDRAVLERAPTGFARVLVRRGSDEVIGATIVGEHAGELIQEFVLAMKHGIGLKQISLTVYAYPTFASLVLKTAERLNKSASLLSRAKSPAGSTPGADEEVAAKLLALDRARDRSARALARDFVPAAG